MAYTDTTKVLLGERVALTASFTATGAQTPFQIPNGAGVYWGQMTFHAVNVAITVLTADLEVDLTETDANFVALIAGLNFFATPAIPLNLNGGNVRYRWNVKTFTGTSSVIHGIAG